MYSQVFFRKSLIVLLLSLSSIENVNSRGAADGSCEETIPLVTQSPQLRQMK